MGEYRELGYYIEQVVVCDTCNGEKQMRGNPALGQWTHKTYKCHSCGGSGKERKTVNLTDALRDLGLMPYEDMRDDPEYQKFEQDMAKNCQSDMPPCDGCLAGGMCDGPIDPEFDLWFHGDDGWYEDEHSIGGNS